MERQLQTETALALLRRLKRFDAVAAGFQDWSAVVAFMHGGSSTDPRKDALLRAVVLAREEDGHRLWSSALLLFFWPGLYAIFSKRRTWDADSDELWQVILAEFLAATARLDVRQRPTRIASKLINDTYKSMHRVYEREWRRHELEHVLEPEDLAPLLPAAAGIDWNAIELRELQEQRIALFRGAFDAGIIGEEDLFLLIGTDAHGQAMADYARARGLSYQAMKKRRQRARAAIDGWCHGRC